MRIWRKLNQLNAGAIKNSVYVLPFNEKIHEDFQWLKKEIEAALVTFGGAYAVLAYVTQVLITDLHNWLTRTQAVDGLALAETTPGSLIMVLQFIGFIAGWNNPGDMSPIASAVTSALITTYVTFLPCFLFTGKSITLRAKYHSRITLPVFTG